MRTEADVQTSFVGFSVTPKTNVHVQIEQCLMCIDVHNFDTHHQLKIVGYAGTMEYLSGRIAFAARVNATLDPFRQIEQTITCGMYIDNMYHGDNQDVTLPHDVCCISIATKYQLVN